MAGKKFKFRSDSNNRVGIKEVVSRTASVRGPKISVSVGLDKDFNFSNKHIADGNIFTPIKSTKGLKQGRGARVIYYPIDEISYIATLTLQYNKSNKLVDKTLTVYIPQDICGPDEIYGVRVTGKFSHEDKEAIIEMLTPYVQSKII